jgi:hypothetical protein
LFSIEQAIMLGDSQKYEKDKDTGQRTTGSFMKTAGSLRLLK